MRYDRDSSPQPCQLINKSGAELLFVAFGAPKQELWLARNTANLSRIKIAMGVGGAFDFIAGEKYRAPIWLRKIGMEWFFRLIQEPKRWKRIYNAVIKFPVVLLTKWLSEKAKHENNDEF